MVMEYYRMQAMQKAGLCGNHSSTRLLVLSPSTLSDVLESILKVWRFSVASEAPASALSAVSDQAAASC